MVRHLRRFGGARKNGPWNRRGGGLIRYICLSIRGSAVSVLWRAAPVRVLDASRCHVRHMQQMSGGKTGH